MIYFNPLTFAVVEYDVSSIFIGYVFPWIAIVIFFIPTACRWDAYGDKVVYRP